MRHINPISKQAPGKADVFSDVVCAVTAIFAGLIDATGGVVPFVEYLDGKCSFGVPEQQ